MSRCTRSGWISAGLLLLLLAAGCAAPPPEAAMPTAVPAPTVGSADHLRVWATDGMERIGREDAPGSSATVDLFAARGEYEPFQVAVQASDGGLSGLNLTVSALRGPDGATIGPEHLTLYREHYVEVRHSSPDYGGSNRPLGVGWYADALIPFSVPDYQAALAGATLHATPASLEPGQNQPYWVDIFVPRDAPSGVYQGSFSITSDQGKAEGNVRLTVWNFELPLRPSLLSAFDLEEHDTIGNIKELLRHRLMPEKAPPEHQRELIDEWGLGASDLSGFWSGANIDTCAMKAAPKLNKLREAREAYQPDLLVYNYVADEIDRCPQLSGPLKDWAGQLHAAGVSTMVTMMPTEDLLTGNDDKGSAVDIWVVLPKRYMANPELARAALAHGTQLWSYNASVQDDYSPKWQIDFAPINFRIQPGFISQSLGLSGILYWQIDRWTADPWVDVGTYVNGDFTLFGDGMFVYPGEQVGIDGVVPSLRLKWIREGIEDYEYVALLKARGQGDWALELARQVGADWKHWTQDPAELERVRRLLGESLSASP